MEDADMEWEIQEYSPSKEGEVTTVRWIFNKGLWLGKKVVITGVAISSTPLVLPPLLVCSALGFAFSVPFGFVFASYACTDKLMNKLLPTSESSPILEYYTDEDEGGGKEGFGKYVVEEEDDEELDKTERTVGKRIYIDEDDKYWRKDLDSWEEQPTVYNDENVEDGGCEEDVGEYLEGEDDYTQEIEMGDENQGEVYKNNIGVILEMEDDNVEEIVIIEERDQRMLVNEESKDEQLDDMLRVFDVVGENRDMHGNEALATIQETVILVPGNEAYDDMTRGIGGTDTLSEVVEGKENEEGTIDNEEDIVRGSTGLLEKLRDERNVGNDVNGESFDAMGMSGVGEIKDEKSATTRDLVGGPFEEDDVLLKKLVEEVKETGEKERAVEETPLLFERDVKLEKPSEEIENVDQENNERNVHDKVEHVGETESFRGILHRTKRQKPEVQEKLPVREERAANKMSAGQVEDMTLKKRESVISSNADMREIADESGFDLSDDRNTTSHQNSYPALQAKDDFNESTTEINVDYMALPTSTRMLASTHVKNGMEKDEVPSSQVQHKEEEEEKIWEQIEAMRAIVGYKIPHKPTFIEELEALYVFTGVEPPASLKDPSDLTDINHKLRFLMSIVGVR